MRRPHGDRHPKATTPVSRPRTRPGDKEGEAENQSVVEACSQIHRPIAQFPCPVVQRSACALHPHSGDPGQCAADRGLGRGTITGGSGERSRARPIVAEHAPGLRVSPLHGPCGGHQGDRPDLRLDCDDADLATTRSHPLRITSVTAPCEAVFVTIF